MDKTKIIVVEDNIVYCEYVCNMLSRVEVFLPSLVANVL